MTPTDKRITIGRKPGNTVVLNNPDISGTHAALRQLDAVGRVWEVQDMGSANGTFVDGIRIYRKEVTRTNQIRLGQTVVAWDLLLGKQFPKPPVSTPPAPQKPEPDDALREIASGLKQVSDEYRRKKNRLAEIQVQESFNGRIQGVAAISGGGLSALLTTLVPDNRSIGLVGFAVTGLLVGGILMQSRKLSRERKTYNNLEDWYKVNYVCPHCHTFIQQPFELLEKTKSCRACKKPLIPNA